MISTTRPLAAAVPNAKLVVLPGVGHMVQNAATERIVSEIDAMIGSIAPINDASIQPPAA